MATFTFEIPDAEASRIALAVCAANGYGPASAEDATQYTAGYVFRHLARIVIDQEAGAAASAAADAVRGNASDPLAQALFTPVVPPPPADWPEGPTGPTGPVQPGTTGSTSFQAIIGR